MTETVAPTATGSDRHAEKNVPAGGGASSRTSDQSQSSLRASSVAPVACWTYGGTERSPQAMASKNQYVFIVRAAVAELMQWLAVKKYGVPLVTVSLSSVPEHR